MYLKRAPVPARLAAAKAEVRALRARKGVRAAIGRAREVEYFDQEASEFTKELALGEQVRLEPDPQCSSRDKYRRLLRYVYLDDGTLLNAEIIAQGYGFAYTKYPFSRMKEFRKLERAARRERGGLWAE